MSNLNLFLQKKTFICGHFYINVFRRSTKEVSFLQKRLLLGIGSEKEKRVSESLFQIEEGIL